MLKKMMQFYTSLMPRKKNVSQYFIKHRKQIAK